MLDAMHGAIRSTRGACGMVVSIDLESHTLCVCGVGNIAGVVMSDGPTRHLVSMNGTLGHEIRGFREFTHPWTGSSMLILHSDGVSSRWDLATYPGLAQRSLNLIAGVLYRDRRRERDDATVVVVRNGNGQ